MRTETFLRQVYRLLATAVIVLVAAGCGGGDDEAADGNGGAKETPLTVFGAFATAIEEPWDGVIHSALLEEEEAGRIEYRFVDDIGYAGDMERVLREAVDRDRLAIKADLALVDRVDASDRLDQGRLAGAVIPDQRHHLTGAGAEVDPLKRLHLAKALGDTAQLERRRALGRGEGRLCSLGLHGALWEGGAGRPLAPRRLLLA